jgi:DNA-binding CsgD family transcriptional regulator
MHIRDNSKAQGWFRKHAAAPSSIGSWKAFVARNKTVQEPRTMAQGGRIGFFKGESVIKSSGQEIIDLVEAGESSVSIAKKLKLKQQTVNNALNSIDQGLAGEKYKLSKPLKELYAPKNQYTGKLLTEDMDLVNAIKKDAETMSQIEVEKKYNKEIK